MRRQVEVKRELNKLANGELGIFAFLKSQPIGFNSGSGRFKEGVAQKQELPGMTEERLNRSWKLQSSAS